MSAILAGKVLPPPPASVDYTKGMPQDLGTMLNNVLANSTCAAIYHAVQVWSFNASGRKNMDTEPDSDVKKLYELACGYNPRIPGEGPGGNSQHVLKYLLTRGFPIGSGETMVKIIGFVEIDPRNIDDVKRAIWGGGCVYIGFSVPASIMPSGHEPLKIWRIDPANPNPAIIGSHAAVLAGYDVNGARAISWGQHYTMSWEFFAKYVDEVYEIADRTWIDATGKTPGGITVQQLEEQMQPLQQEQPTTSLQAD